MRLKITTTFYKESDWRLRLQGFIYHNMTPELHNSGYVYRHRSYKPLVFASRSVGQNTEFYLSFLTEAMGQHFLELFRKTPILTLGDTALPITSIEEIPFPNFGDGPVQIEMMSPVSAKIAGIHEHKTTYYAPYMPKFSQLINQNIKNKFQAFNQVPVSGDISITPTKNENMRKVILNHWDTIIEAYYGWFVLQGSAELIKLSYNVGLGSRNGQGLGMWKLVSQNH